ncbi:MAG: hypothetical protein WAS36_01475 [Candidatus Saccharimonadales bacterium]
MTNPQHPTNNEAQTALKFIEPMDSSYNVIPQAELTQARDEFVALVRDMHIRFPESLDVYNEDPRETHASLGGLGISYQDGTKLVFSVESSTYRDSLSRDEEMIWMVGVYEVDDEGKSLNAHVYENDLETGVVHRRDNVHKAYEHYNAVAESFLSADNRDKNMGNPIDIFDLADVLGNDRDNYDFAVEMGLNNQPVSLDEIRKLRQLLEQAHLAQAA